MTKEEFINYISNNNPGNYKKRKVHIKNVAPEILGFIDDHIKNNALTPINFNDSINYYINDCAIQNKCVCGKIIKFNYIFCSNKCKNENIHEVLNKSKATLKKLYGKESPLQIEEFKNKFKDTSKQKYGTVHPSQNKEIKNKIQETNKITYENKDLRNTIGIKVLNAYENNREDIIDKRRQTNYKKYGEYKTLTTNSVNKAKETLKHKYNVSNPFNVHEDTYEKAKLGSIDFFSKNENKESAIRKRIETITKKYGSLENMNNVIFEKRKTKIFSDLRNNGFTDDIIDYNKNNIGSLLCKCKYSHNYEISFRLLRYRLSADDIICTECSPPLTTYVSNGEIELYNWLSEYVYCKRNNRSILSGQEIDIYIPSYNIAIEFNGIYWHSDLFKDKNYHLNKTLILKDKSIQLIHVWEDQWNNKKDIIKGRLLSILNKTQLNIGARKCVLKEIESKIANEFYENNHLQGKTKGSLHVGLFYDNELISALSVGKRKLGKNKEDNVEILRFCNKIGVNCAGSFSKMFSYIKSKITGKFISYADLGWGDGSVYKHAGFNLLKYTTPNYWYFIKGERYHRYAYTKGNLIKKGYDKNKTEKQIMDEDIKALRVYDCGNALWEL